MLGTVTSHLEIVFQESPVMMEFSTRSLLWSFQNWKTLEASTAAAISAVIVALAVALASMTAQLVSIAELVQLHICVSELPILQI